MNNPGNVLGVA